MTLPQLIRLFPGLLVLSACTPGSSKPVVLAPPSVICDCGAPPAAPTFLVFFALGKTDLTPKSLYVISLAARKAIQTHSQDVQVSGFTDSSGTVLLNEKLALGRALAVEAQLAKDGVSKLDIVIQSFGESHLLVPTGPGVEEPQNRRAEIVVN